MAVAVQPARDLNIFSSPADLLDPARKVTSLVYLDDHPFMKDDVRIGLKMLSEHSPNGKIIAAYQILADAHESGALEGCHTAVEYTSGGTGIALAMLAPHYKLKLFLLLPGDIPATKWDQFRLMGTDCKKAGGSAKGIAEAKELGKQPGWFHLNQYSNYFNAHGHERVTAAQIWEQTAGKISVFCAGLGTTGTIVGAARFFGRHKAKVHTVGVMLAPGEEVPGIRDERRLGPDQIGLPWRSAVDTIVTAGRKESFRCSLQLYRKGILAGPSAGAAVMGMFNFLEGEKGRDPRLSSLRNEDGEVLAVVPCMDTPLLYQEKYSSELRPEEFAVS